MPHAHLCGARLAIEPLRPMLIAERSAIVSLDEACTLPECFSEADVASPPPLTGPATADPSKSKSSMTFYACFRARRFSERVLVSYERTLVPSPHRATNSEHHDHGRHNQPSAITFAFMVVTSSHRTTTGSLARDFKTDDGLEPNVVLLARRSRRFDSGCLSLMPLLRPLPQRCTGSASTYLSAPGLPRRTG